MLTRQDLKMSLVHQYPLYDFHEMYDTDGFVRFQPNPFVLAWKNEYIFKLHGTAYEMNMIYLAGDCAVPVLGPAMQKGKIAGFVMRRETPLRDCLSNKKEIMYNLIQLTEDLHGKGIIHGDIKLDNMLLCADGKIRFCDFTGSILKRHSSEGRVASTPNYLSPYRALNPKGPFTEEDDRFALGVTIWEIFTGKRPFIDWKGGYVREKIRAGFVVDLSEIEDEEARQVAEELMSYMLQKSPQKMT